MPLIACLHGGGSNAAVYKEQCSQLEHLLEPDFRFVYFEAPFEHPPGHGMLPAFAEYAPFKSWFTKDDTGAQLMDGSGYDRIGRDGVERVLDMMEQQGNADEWVGAIGFSQGTRMVGGLLLDQQRRESLGGAEACKIRLRFGVLCMGAGPPMEAESGHQKEIDEQLRNDPISLPTLHVHGLRDPFFHLTEQQTETYFNPQTRQVLEVDYHHAMPWVKKEVLQLAAMIRALNAS